MVEDALGDLPGIPIRRVAALVGQGLESRSDLGVAAGQRLVSLGGEAAQLVASGLVGERLFRQGDGIGLLGGGRKCRQYNEQEGGRSRPPSNSASIRRRGRHPPAVGEAAV